MSIQANRTAGAMNRLPRPPREPIITSSVFSAISPDPRTSLGAQSIAATPARPATIATTADPGVIRELPAPESPPPPAPPEFIVPVGVDLDVLDERMLLVGSKFSPGVFVGPAAPSSPEFSPSTVLIFE